MKSTSVNITVRTNFSQYFRDLNINNEFQKDVLISNIVNFRLEVKKCRGRNTEEAD